MPSATGRSSRSGGRRTLSRRPRGAQQKQGEERYFSCSHFSCRHIKTSCAGFSDHPHSVHQLVVTLRIRYARMPESLAPSHRKDAVDSRKQSGSPNLSLSCRARFYSRYIGLIDVCDPLPIMTSVACVLRSFLLLSSSLLADGLRSRDACREFRLRVSLVFRRWLRNRMGILLLGPHNEIAPEDIGRVR